MSSNSTGRRSIWHLVSGTRACKRDDRRNGIPSDVGLLRNLANGRDPDDEGRVEGEGCVLIPLEISARFLRRGGLAIVEVIVIGKEIWRAVDSSLGQQILP